MSTNSRRALRMASTFVLGIAARANAATLSSNLANTTAGVESASGNRWLAASFTSGTSAHTLNSVSLLLANPVVGSAQAFIYSSSTLEPASLVATLTSPATYSASLGPTVFTAPGGVGLAANTSYWVVLRSISGQFNWAWTSVNTGTGAGFKNLWAVSDDAGAAWWFHDIYTTQMSVTVDLCAGDVTGNGGVDVADLLAVISAWGACATCTPATCPADIAPAGGNCVVDVQDLLSVISHWGGCTPP